MSLIRRYFDPIRSRWYAQKLEQPSTIEITPLSIYLRLDDVYSYLVVQILDDIDDILQDQIKPLHIYISKKSALPPSNMSQIDWQNYCLNDAKILAAQHNFSYADIPELPTQDAIEKAHYILEKTLFVGREFLYLLEDIFHILWQQQYGKLETLYLLAKNEQTLSKNYTFDYTDKAILTAYFEFSDREYHAVDGLLRLTRRLQQLKLLTAPPIFLINHIEWREHSIHGVAEIADIQALQPELDLYIALEDPMSWLILAYIKEQLLEYYNIQLKLYPIEYQEKDQFDWRVAYRLSQRTSVPFSPFCRPDAIATQQMAKLFYAVDEDKQISTLYAILYAVWVKGKDLSYHQHVKQLQEQLNIDLVPHDIYQKLHENTMQCMAKHQPNLPVLELRIDGKTYVFNSLYRIWLIESIFSHVLEHRYKELV